MAMFGVISWGTSSQNTALELFENFESLSMASVSSSKMVTEDLLSPGQKFGLVDGLCFFGVQIT